LFYLDEMLPLEIKQSGSKLLRHSDLRRGVFPEGGSQSFKKRKRDIRLGTWNVRSLYKAARELARFMASQEVGGGRGDWMELAQDRDRWRALVSTVKNLRVP
jgi:hypothetical protein